MTDAPIASGVARQPDGREITVSLYCRPNEQNPFYLVYRWQAPVPAGQDPRGYVPKFDIRPITPSDQTTYGDIVLPDRVINVLSDLGRYGYDVTTNGPAFPRRDEARIVRPDLWGLTGCIIEHDRTRVFFRVFATGRTLNLGIDEVEVWDQDARTYRPLS